jgi:hypothetical protein
MPKKFDRINLVFIVVIFFRFVIRFILFVVIRVTFTIGRVAMSSEERVSPQR